MMDPGEAMQVAMQVVELLKPHSSEDRRQILAISLAALGENPTDSGKSGDGGRIDIPPNSVPPRAQIWMKQNNIDMEMLSEVYQTSDGSFELITGAIPGKSKKEKTLNVFVLTGLAVLFTKGVPQFEDKRARALCISAGCYDENNHATYMKDAGNDFTGSKDAGWTLTSPGLKRAAQLIRELSKPSAT